MKDLPAFQNQQPATFVLALHAKLAIRYAESVGWSARGMGPRLSKNNIKCDPEIFNRYLRATTSPQGSVP